jgi:hypothetical protein
MEATTQAGAESYLTKVRGRLDAAGYAWLDTGGLFTAAARKKRFQLTKFGMWETFFVFRQLGQLDRAGLQALMGGATAFAFENRSVALPRGLFAGMATFGVALAQSVDAATALAVREEAPPKHWAANEIPVVFDAGANRLYYFEKTPVWGAAYHKGFRKQIAELLTP